MPRRALARLGFAATGVLYAVLGLTAARLALRGALDPAAGLDGALRWVLDRPHGRLLVALVGAGLASFAVWHTLEARRSRTGALVRAGHVASAAGYAVLTGSAAALFRSGRPATGTLTRSTLAWLLARPAGVFLLEAVAAATVAAGAYEVWQGVSGRLRQRFATRWLPRHAARFAQRMARFGLAARGTVLVLIGYFQWRVARDLDPSEARQIGGALRVVSRTAALGPLLAAVVAVGLAAYGVYMGALAVAARRPGG